LVSALLFAIAAIPSTGVFRLPPGAIDLEQELHIPDNAHDLEITGDHTTLRASNTFHGRALLICTGCRSLTIRNVAFDGNREALAKPLPVPPSDRTFAQFFPNNGILLDRCDGVSTDHLEFRAIAGFAILTTASKQVTIEHATVADSGSRNSKDRNNTTGGILFEEGTQDFSVTDSSFQNVLGNALWTHSRYGSPRNVRGRFINNRFATIGRDAIQVGHASRVQVTGNTGNHIGYPAETIDVEGGGTPVAIDTAGNVDQTSYADNEFTEINGKCFDLDGFHDGAVRGNKCTNRGQPGDYVFGHFGIVFNNSNIDMQSKNIVVENNEMDGMKFGGIFVIGTGHQIRNNRLRHLNAAHCNENKAQFGCAVLDEPDILQSGIYLGSHADRPAPARDNVIEGNTITGWKMSTRCIVAAPTVKLTDNKITNNRCSDE
jgi:parallel beta helix pectate lyase-like protein